MADLRTLTLALVADVDKFKKGLDKADKESRSFSDKLKTALKAGAAAFAAVGAAAGAFAIKIGKDAIGAASDFNEELSKSEVIFGSVAKQVQDFAKNAATNLGQSRTEALRAASNFAIFGKAAGLSGQSLADFSTDFVNLASDLASFNNTSPEDAIQALGAALRGEAEPIRRYGVLISANALDQAAYNYELRTGIELARTEKNQLTDSAKVLARYQEILDQTKDAQGDFNRTSDGLANTQRQLKAALTDVRTELGQAFLPKAQEIANALKNEILPTFTAFIKTLVGGPRALDASSYFAFKAQENLGKKMGDNEYAGFNLAMAIRTLAAAFRDLFSEVEIGTESSGGFARFINDLAVIIEKIAAAIRGIDSLIERLGGLRQAFQIFSGPAGALLGVVGGAPSAISGFNQSRAQSQAIVQNLAANQRGANTAPIVVNVRGAIDPQGTARTVTKVLSQQRSISGVRVTAPAGFF